MFLGFVITVKSGYYAESFVSRNSKIDKILGFSAFPPIILWQQNTSHLKCLHSPLPLSYFFVDFSLMFLITCVIYISIVTLDCLISSFYWLQKVFTREKSLFKHIGLVCHHCVMKFSDCCAEIPNVLFIFQFKCS